MSGWKPGRVMVSTLLLVLSSVPLAANGQSKADSVELLVQAALVAVDSMASAVTIFLDPRPELRRDSLRILAFEALKGVGYEDYGEPGIPPRDVWLISPGTIREWNDSIRVSARFRAFGSIGYHLNSYSYAMTFHVEDDEGGFVLGHWLSREHGDGHVSAKCWEDFYARTAEERKACYGTPRRPGPARR